jgi:hypothetical protein
MSGFAFGSGSAFSSEAKESKPFSGFGSTPFFRFKSEAKESKPKVKKQLTQEELDQKIKIKQERKEAKLILDKIKIEEYIKKSESIYKQSEYYLKEIETFYNSLDESQSIFILSDIKIIYQLAKTFTEKAKLAYEATIKSTTVRQADKYVKSAEFAESVVFENYTKMKIEKNKSKYKYKNVNYTSSKELNKKELSGEEMFELKVDKWFKGKKFEQVIQKICEIIDTEKVRNIIYNLNKHKNIMKSYKELSVIFHPDNLNRNSDLSEFEKFKYITIYKVINIAKSEN